MKLNKITKVCIFLSLIIILNINSFVYSFTHIDLKKSDAEYHHEYLKSLKFIQVNKKQKYSSFLEQQEISLHQQVLAQKKLATYYGELQVGTNQNPDQTFGQTFKMLFDTGSCEFWVPSSQCTTKRCLTHARYNQSPSFAPYYNAKMSIQYLSGKVQGDMATETISLGDLLVHNQVIGVAKEVEIPLLDEVIWDGILGLAHPNSNLREKHISPLFDSIMQQHLLVNKGEKNQFAYYLGMEKGAITLGGADMKYKKDLNEEFKWAPTIDNNYWTISLIDIRKYKPNRVNIYKY